MQVMFYVFTFVNYVYLKLFPTKIFERQHLSISTITKGKIIEDFNHKIIHF